MKDMQTEKLLCWSGMTDTESSISGSNRFEVIICKNLSYLQAGIDEQHFVIIYTICILK